MNPTGFLHVVSIWRRPTEITDLTMPTQAFTQAHAAVRCNLEPLAARRREKFIGPLSVAQLLMTCGAADSTGTAVQLRDGDLMVVVSGPAVTPGTEWLIAEGDSPISDLARPGGFGYQVAGLTAPPHRLRPA